MECSWSAHGVNEHCSWSPWEGVGECKVFPVRVIVPSQNQTPLLGLNINLRDNVTGQALVYKEGDNVRGNQHQKGNRLTYLKNHVFQLM